jgi:hypothetical protein
MQHAIEAYLDPGQPGFARPDPRPRLEHDAELGPLAADIKFFTPVGSRQVPKASAPERPGSMPKASRRQEWAGI